MPDNVNNKGYNPQSNQRPASFAITEIRELNSEMANLCMRFSSICDRMEACARNVREYARRADRELFKPFFDAGLCPGRYLRFLGTKNADEIFQCTGMDGKGFYFVREKGGMEFYLNVFEHQDVAHRIRIIRRNSWRGRTIGADIDTAQPDVTETQLNDFEEIEILPKEHREKKFHKEPPSSFMEAEELDNAMIDLKNNFDLLKNIEK